MKGTTTHNRTTELSGEKKNLCGYPALNNYDMCAQSNRFC
jgi:hypothetical protein